MKQKFDVFVWDEVKTNEKITHPKGNLRLRLSQPSPLFIEAQGVEALAGYATDFDVEVSEEVTFRVEAPKGVRAFVYNPLPTSTEADGEVFTNIDRLPHESGAMAEVMKARRMLEIEKRQMVAEIRREMAITRNATKATDKTKAKAQVETETEAEGEAEGETEEAQE